MDHPGSGPGGAEYLPVTGREDGPLVVKAPWIEGVIEGIMVEDAGMKEDFIIKDWRGSWSSVMIRRRGGPGEGEWEGVFLCPGGGNSNWLGGIWNPVVEDWLYVEGDCSV